MGIPLVIVCGKAGSGKDTIGNYIAEKFNGITMGLADPMKRLAKELFDFTDDQLYGPSEFRNQVDPRFSPLYLQREVDRKLDGVARKACKEFLGLGPNSDSEDAFRAWYWETVREAGRAKGLSARYVLQTLGTEWGREQDVEIWSRFAIQTARRMLGAGHIYDRRVGLVRSATVKRPPDLVVITDGRFSNEIVNTKSAGGVAVQVVRHGAADTTTTGVKGHSSEAGLDEVPPHFFDHRYVNDGTLEDLYVLADILGGHVTASCIQLLATRAAFDRQLYGVAYTRHLI